ncbi:MAG: hypothetical protein V7K92_07320 [Nostoc sp.]|uniref:hypothetical protein n=1 Tax=Nostoc sp. TaxID=1180 RepID=UPI002FF2FE49
MTKRVHSIFATLPIVATVISGCLFFKPVSAYVSIPGNANNNIRETTGLKRRQITPMPQLIAIPLCNVPDPPPICDHEPRPRPVPVPVPVINLTGKWQANDGGTYYIRQIGNQVWWYGEYSPTNPAFSNVFNGTINNNQISGNWADVPKGSTLSSGSLQLRIVSYNRIEAVSQTGGFGGSVWFR